MISNNRRKKKVMIYFSMALMVVLGVCVFIANGHAEPYDVTNCGSGGITTLVESNGLKVLSFDMKGISRSNIHPNAFDSMSFQCISTVKIVSGKNMGQGYCKFIDKDGDFVVTETTIIGQENNSNALYGTGKWKGIKAEGKIVWISSSIRIVKGTIQNCTRSTGTFTLTD